ncbi:MAG TPA: ferrochelatase, partial [Burkholderiales bacterium]|nr:ferrochelatase [Burkholderiales bacterium]
MVPGILLVNLGTPQAPTREAVRRYLAEFLSDPRVVALPRFVWLPILHGIVLRTRPALSAEKYAAIWTPEGSPLAVNTARLATLLARRTGAPVGYAMRYGTPGLRAALATGPEPGVVVPLYPQYSRSTTESVRDCLPRGIRMIESFHDHPAYIAALASRLRAHWEAHGPAERLLLSFHGLPQRAVDRGDPYETQCRTTAALLAASLGISGAQFQVSFQSRFGAAKWLQPYTQPLLVQLARSGVRRVDVMCPGFVCDCLETLEEINIVARRAFLEAGGAQLRYIPCLND